MSYKVNNKAAYTSDGIPYLWNSGDVTTLPSNEVKILQPDGINLRYFGTDVKIGCGRILINVPGDGTNGTSSGAVWIFDINGNQISKLLAPDGQGSDFFGGYFSLHTAISIGCGRIVVGAPGDDDAGNSAGSAYIFNIDGTFITKIVPNDIVALDLFGTSVSVGNDRIVVGAYGVDPAGAAYIFDLDGNQIVKITASDAVSGNFFGVITRIGCGRIVIGDSSNNSYTGAIYIFDLDGNEIKKITASDASTGDNFGANLAIGSGRIVVGATGATDNGTNSGAAYIFDLDGNELAKILPNDGAASDRFGNYVSVGSGRIIICAGDDHNENGADAGAIYVYDLDGNFLTKVIASDGLPDDTFGTSVAVGSGKIVVGAREADDEGNLSGAAYIYDTPQVYNLYDAIDLKENS